MMPVLDSNLLIRLDAGDPKAAKVLQALNGEKLVVPAQVALEFLVGVDDVDDALISLEAAFDLEMPDREHIAAAAKAGQSVRERGHRIRSGDAWIAAHALRRDDFVVSTNKRDFTRLGVACWHYEQETTPPAMP